MQNEPCTGLGIGCGRCLLEEGRRARGQAFLRKGCKLGDAMACVWLDDDSEPAGRDADPCRDEAPGWTIVRGP